MQSTASDSLSAIEIQWHLTSTRIDEWMQNDLFSFRWWALLAIFTVSLYAWWKLTDKSRLNETVLYTGLITVITLILDELGEELTLWDYPIDLIPLFPPLSAIDIASLPMVYSLIYQYFRPWKKFITATVIMASIFCFILEPLFVLSGVYQTLTWKYYYGFPIYILMAICTKAVVIKLYKIAGAAKKPDCQ